MSLMGSAVRPSLALGYDSSVAETEPCVSCPCNPDMSDSTSPLRCCVLDLPSFACARGESSTNYTPDYQRQSPSSAFDRLTHRDLPIHLPYPTRHSTSAPGHKGQIIAILASKSLNLTIGTPRLLFIAWQLVSPSHKPARHQRHTFSPPLPTRQTARPYPLLPSRRGFARHGDSNGGMTPDRCEIRRERAEPPSPRKVVCEAEMAEKCKWVGRRA